MALILLYVLILTIWIQVEVLHQESRYHQKIPLKLEKVLNNQLGKIQTKKKPLPRTPLGEQLLILPVKISPTKGLNTTTLNVTIHITCILSEKKIEKEKRS